MWNRGYGELTGHPISYNGLEHHQSSVPAGSPGTDCTDFIKASMCVVFYFDEYYLVLHLMTILRDGWMGGRFLCHLDCQWQNLAKTLDLLIHTSLVLFQLEHSAS